ncbi:MAG: TRAP transporter small permease subunit, partial [Methylobacteriaceae bacterium]|nr:TRAP transporter small permease subunit [Methylobacteriaceae bacterium]
MTGSIFVQVLCRFVFQVAAPWTEELARYLFIWICIVGSGIAISRGAHLGI